MYGATVPLDEDRDGTAIAFTCISQPGTGRLIVAGGWLVSGCQASSPVLGAPHPPAVPVVCMAAGNVDDTARQSVQVARSFLQLHEPWLAETFGELALPPTSPAHDVIVHLAPALFPKLGLSMGAAALGTYVTQIP